MRPYPPLRVLIVENDLVQSLTCADLIEDMGLAVAGPFRNLDDAYYFARHEPIDFALLDFELMDGTDTIPIAQVLEERGIPFAITTAGFPGKVQQRFDTAARIIAKPVAPATLIQLLPVVH